MIEFSILCLERMQLNIELPKLIPYIDSLHLDIMDGNFVKNTAYTPDEINNLEYNLPKHVHIMAYEPEKYIEKLINIESISFHFEAVTNHDDIINIIKNKGFKAGIVINPETSIDEIQHLLNKLDRVVIMAVKPGYSGQKYIPSTSKSIVALRKLDKNTEIVIDGGMHEDTIREVMTLGANACVVCSVIVKSKNYGAKVKELKESGIIGYDNWAEISDNLFQPFSLSLSFENGSFNPCSNHWVRRLSELKDIYNDQEVVANIISKSDPIVYEVWQQDVPFDNGHLLAVTTRLYPGKVGDEYYMTKGHFHAKENTAEIYLGLKGEGLLLMQPKIGPCKSLKILPGTVSYIPPYWAHRVVNIGRDDLVFYGVYPADAGHDYASIVNSTKKYFGFTV